ncbi:MAG: hypothetical protein JZU63_00095, partial [Rhodoferax sp.]|nr:hypothetical protein [Rhodoferax sp.]
MTANAGIDGMSMRADLGVTGYIATGSIIPVTPPVSFTDQTLDGNWNTLPNGGFESGLTGWTAQGGPGGGPVNGTFATSNEFHILGAASARSQPIIDFSGPGFAIYQDVAVIPGKTYVLSGFTYVPVAGPEAHFRLDVDWALLEVYASGPNGQWQFNYAKFKGPADSNARIRVVEDNIVHKPDVGYFDEVAVTPLELFHPPSYVTGNFLGYSAAGNALTSPFTDYISGPGNLLSYDIYNNIGNGAMAMAMFGTHFLATIEAGFQGTDHGSHVTEAFGTY